MTQQNETGQYAATDESGPSFPSPYLEATEAAPQAYLAPPQPDQPKYGTPPAYRTRPRADGSASQPHTGLAPGQQPGYGQSGYGQARNRANARTSPRDPALAAVWQRLAASFVDLIIIYVVSALPYWSSLLRIFQQWDAIFASSPGRGSPAAQAAVINFLADPSTQRVLAYWHLTLLGLALVYYSVQHAAWGATVGKRIVGVRVVQANGGGRIGVKAAGIRAVTFFAGPVIWMLAPPIAVAGGVLFAADTGLSLFDPRAQCLHDKVAGTLVMKKRWLDQQALSADR